MRLFTAVILSIFGLLLSFGICQFSTLYAQDSGSNSNYRTVKVAKNGSHGADIFIDPKTNRVYITYIKTQNNGSDLYFTKSIDENYTFSNPIRVNDKMGDVMWDGRVPPQIELSYNGTIYTLWVSSTEAPAFAPYGFRTLKMAASVDGGETFTPAVNVSNKGDSTYSKAFQGFDIGTDGKIYVGYLNWDAQVLKNGTIISTDTENGTQASISVSADGGKTFKPILRMDKFTCECCNVNVLATSNGDVYASWRNKFPVAPNTDPEVDPVTRDIVVTYSADGGITFNPANKMANDSFVFGGCVHVGAPMVEDSKGILHIVWYTGAEDHPGMYYAHSNDKGKTFSKPIAVLTGEWIPPLRSDIGIDSQDSVWLTWEDSYGLTALDEKWKFENTSANIFLGKIVNNSLIKLPPVNTENGRSPEIATGNNLIGVLWNGDGSIKVSLLRPNELST